MTSYTHTHTQHFVCKINNKYMINVFCWLLLLYLHYMYLCILYLKNIYDNYHYSVSHCMYNKDIIVNSAEDVNNNVCLACIIRIYYLI